MPQQFTRWGALLGMPHWRLPHLPGAQVWLTIGSFTVPSGPAQSERHVLAPYFVTAWSRETQVDPIFWWSIHKSRNYDKLS